MHNIGDAGRDPPTNLARQLAGGRALADPQHPVVEEDGDAPLAAELRADLE